MDDFRELGAGSESGAGVICPICGAVAEYDNDDVIIEFKGGSCRKHEKTFETRAE
jgi:hypothetical protein